jgi:hypothetical protein
MRKVFALLTIATAALLTSAIAHGQVPSVLLEACNAMQDADKRLECFKAATNRQSPAPAPYEVLSRTFIGLQSGLGVGVSYNNYQAALLDVAKELGVFERSAPPEATAAIVNFRQALDTYKDAATFWQASIEFFARSNNSTYAALPVNLVGLEWMVDKHKLPTRSADLLGFNVGVETDLGLRKMWRDAAEQAAVGFRLLGDPAAVAASDKIVAPRRSSAAIERATGIVVSELTPDLAIERGLRKGVKVDSVAGGSARGGLQEGDIITALGNTEIGSVEEFEAVVGKLNPEKNIAALVRRGRLAVYVLVRPLQKPNT